MGSKQKAKSKKGRKKAKGDKHPRRCACDACSKKRSKRTWNKRKVANARRWAKETKEEKRKVKTEETPSFLAGGHPNIRRDFTFEGGDWSEPLTSLHQRARALINKTFPDSDVKTIDHIGNPYDTGYKLFRAHKIELDQDKLQNIDGKTDLLWHGTSLKNVSNIGHNSLEVRGTYCLLGAGIYLAPSFTKAFGFSGYSSYKTVLLCAAKLGKVLDSKDSVTHAEDCGKKKASWGKCSRACKYIRPTATIVRNKGFDSASAYVGYHPGAYSNRLRHSEYCAYDENRVLPLYVCTFTRKNY